MKAWWLRLRQLPQGLRIVLVCILCLTLAGAVIGVIKLWFE